MNSFDEQKKRAGDPFENQRKAGERNLRENRGSMTAIDHQQGIRTGKHWLVLMAKSLGLELIQVLNDRDLWQWEIREIALELYAIEAESTGKEQAAKLHIRCFPEEKKAITRAAGREKVEVWIRKILAEAAQKKS